MSNDPRFARLHSDPRFVRPKASKNKIQVDERFKSIFEDADATASGSGKRSRKVDKYGRPLEKEATSNELKRYYRMASPDAAAEEDQEQQGAGDEEDESQEEDGDEDGEEGEAPEKSFLDMARGEGLMESSDEEGAGTDSSDDEGSVTLAPAMLRRRRPSRSPSIDLSETEAVFANESDIEQDEESDEEGIDATTRLAVVNMDWDHIRAADLYRVLASSLSATAIPAAKPKPSKTGITKFDADGNEIDDSYKPASRLTIAKGRLLHLRIYPSSFGAERMEREAREGPPTEVFAAGGLGDSDEEDEGTMVMSRKKKSSRRKRRDEDSDDEITEKDIVREQLEEGGEDYDGEALRRYQLERLRYYYAVATFDTPEAAAHVFSEINGTEFERTANVFDLQYIPDETSFEGDTIHDEATESSIAAAGTTYEGVEFVTDALRHSKVKLTWDADDPHRKSKIQSFLASATDVKGKGKKDMNDADIAAYLASSSDEDEAEDEGAEEKDDFFEAADEKAPQSKRDKLRSLFGLDGGDAEEQSWDGGKASGKGAEGGMQITFAPALSTKKGKKGAFDSDEEEEEDQDNREESAIETYKRKEKERRERKKLERKAKRDGKTLPPVGEEGPEFGGEDVGPGGFDDDFFADDGRDPFATLDAGEDSGDEIGVATKKGKKADKGMMSKAERRRAKEAEEEANKQAQAELALLVDSDKEDDGSRHFDMRSILKAEKNAGKKARKGKKGKKAEEKPAEDNFKIDLKDDRFKSLHEDYDFAIDPTSNRFQKTRNMNLLLDEGRKRRAKNQSTRAPVGAPLSAGAKKEWAQANEGESLSKLIESVKRKAGETGGRGKRAKVGEQ